MWSCGQQVPARLRPVGLGCEHGDTATHLPRAKMTDRHEWAWLSSSAGTLRRGNRGAALHKPLLLALATSRQPRWHRFIDLEADLAELLILFGGVTRAEPHRPFWHLQNDDGLWVVRLAQPDDLDYGANGRQPTRTSLRKSFATSGLGDRVWALVQADREKALSLISAAALDDRTSKRLEKHLKTHLSGSLQI